MLFGNDKSQMFFYDIFATESSILSKTTSGKFIAIKLLDASTLVGHEVSSTIVSFVCYTNVYWNN